MSNPSERGLLGELATSTRGTPPTALSTRSSSSAFSRRLPTLRRPGHSNWFLDQILVGELMTVGADRVKRVSLVLGERSI